MKKGYALLLDAIVALTFTLVILTSLIGLRQNSTQGTQMTMGRLHYVSEDALDVLNKDGILDQIGEEWAAADFNRSSPHFINASNLAKTYFDTLLPPNMGYMLTIDDDEVANNTRIPYDSSNSLSHSTRLLVGYSRGLPTRGNVARSFLTNIKDKETSSYLYFGGFVGQGNITAYVRDIPPDAGIQDCCIEMNTPSSFDLYLNGHMVRNFAPAPGVMNANIVDVSELGCPAQGAGTPGCFKDACEQYAIKGGDNQFDLDFTSGNLSDQYVGGGFIRMTYNTSEMDTDRVTQVSKYYFPGIDGVINLYDSFYVPGTLTDMDAYLHFKSNYSDFFNIGQVSIYNWSGGTYSDQEVTISKSDMKNNYGFIYTPGDPKSLSSNTVPIRVGTGNMSMNTVLDIALVQDRSGSMLQSGWTMNFTGNATRNFTDVSVPSYGWSQVMQFNVTGPLKTCSPVVVEAENYTLKTNAVGTNHKWMLNTTLAGYSGTGYMYVLPDSGTNNNAAGYSTKSPELRYNITLPENGTYYVWLRVYAADGSADSVHVGFDYTENPSSEAMSNIATGGWKWTNTIYPSGNIATITSPTTGKHVLDVWMREDGINIDKIVLTKDPTYDPSTGSCANQLNGSLAVALNWDQRQLPAYPGSDASEFVLNVQRPDGTYMFAAEGDAGGTVDPGGGTVGNANEYYSGIDSKPQIIQVDYPQTGRWNITVYGHNLRPSYNRPPSMNVNVSTYVDLFNQSNDDFSRNPTIISLTTAENATKSFIDSMEPTDRGAYIVFGSVGHEQTLQSMTSNKTLLKAAVDNTGTEGGTAIDTGLNNATRELVGHTRQNATKVIILTTDGQNDAGPEPVLNASAAAKGNGSIVFVVGMTAFVNNDLLGSAASSDSHGNPYYFYTPDASGLQQIYARISQILTADYRIQSVNVSGRYLVSTLYPDSYIEFEYTPLNQSSYGEVSLKRSTCRFNDPSRCTGGINVPSEVVISDAKVTSYSGPYWTDYLGVGSGGTNSYTYLLSRWANNSFIPLGDPYILQIPVEKIRSGFNNTLTIWAGYYGAEQQECSPDDRAIYTMRLHTMASYGDVFQKSEGCSWHIEFQDGTMYDVLIPEGYAGTNQCYYTHAKNSQSVKTYPVDDAMADAVYRLMNQLDLDKDGRVDLLFDTDMIKFEITQASGVQSLWGPAEFKLVVWM